MGVIVNMSRGTEFMGDGRRKEGVLGVKERGDYQEDQGLEDNMRYEANELRL